jgi:hypothetical protein
MRKERQRGRGRMREGSRGSCCAVNTGRWSVAAAAAAQTPAKPDRPSQQDPRAAGGAPSGGVDRAARDWDENDVREDCPGRKPPKSAAKRPSSRPYKSAIERHGNTKGA